jgi:hypothetical protein
VHDDVDSTEPMANCLSDCATPCYGREIRSDELNPVWKTGRSGSGGRKNRRAFDMQSVRDRKTDAFAGPGHQRAQTAQLGGCH